MVQVSSIRDLVLEDKNVPVTVLSSTWTIPTSLLPNPLELPKHTGTNDHPIDLVDFKSSAGAPILPIRKKDGSFQLCI